MTHYSERSTRQWARIWSDNLQLPCVLPPTHLCNTSNFLVYNLQLPYKFDSHQFIMVEMVMVVAMVIMVVMAMVIRLSMLIIVTKVTMVTLVTLVTLVRSPM